MFAIIIPTYRRKDGNTPKLLKRCLDSVAAQTCRDFKLFIVGDKYEGEEEIKHLIPTSAWYENLSFAYERDKYTGRRLWCTAGGYAFRYAMYKAVAEGFEYLISLDHDDWWKPNHLQLFEENKPFAWACAKSTHIGNRVLPRISTSEKVVSFLPQPKNVIGSSVCWNYALLPLTSRNVYEETGKDVPGDIDRWNRMSAYITKHSLRSIMINDITCFRDQEGAVLQEFMA